MSDGNPSTEPTYTPAEATPSAPAAPTATPTSAPAAPVAAATPISATPSAGAPAVEPSWLKQRLDETRQSTTRQLQAEWGRREAEYNARLEQTQRQLQALAGVTPPQNPEVEQVKSQFGNLYPGLAKIEDKAEAIMQIIERANDLQAQNEHYWSTHANRTMDSVYKAAETALGGQLNDDAKRHLYTSFIGYVQSSPELTQRYSQDPTIVDDFMRAFTSSFIDPVRRAASATVQGRASTIGGLPQDTPSGSVRTNNAPKPANLDERAQLAFELYKQKTNIGG